MLYFAPELLQAGSMPTKESDVYAFAILVAEGCRDYIPFLTQLQ